MASFEITEINPILDVHNKTANVGMELVLSAFGKQMVCNSPAVERRRIWIVRNAMTLGLMGGLLTALRILDPRFWPGRFHRTCAAGRRQRIASDPKEIVNLWPGTPPGGEGLTLANRVTDRSSDPLHPDRYTDHIGVPSLTMFRPDRAEGSAVILAPGGGYVREVLDGHEVLRQRGG